VSAKAISIWHKDSVHFFCYALEYHWKARAGAINVAALVEELVSGFIVSQQDQGLLPVDKSIDWSVLLKPLSVCVP
jgi:hypothetical protein